MRKKGIKGMAVVLAAALCLTALPVDVVPGKVAYAATDDEDDDGTEEEDGIENGDGTQDEGKSEDWGDNVWVISDAEDLCKLSGMKSSFEGQTIVLDADIDLNGGGKFGGICMNDSTPFKGTFDGCGHYISGIRMSSGDSRGLFGYVAEGGVVKNVTIKDSDFSSEGCSYIAGAVVGCFLYGGTVSNCHAENIKMSDGGASSVLGGIVGKCILYSLSVVCNVVNCSFDGTIDGGGYYVGGIIGGVDGGDGRNNDKISVRIANCANHGEINGKDCAGGIAGYLQVGDVINCYNTGVATVNKDGKVGALVGDGDSSSSVQYSYAMEGTADVLANGVSQTPSDGNDIFSQEYMLSSKFVDTLNKNITGLNDYFPWIYKEGEYPVLREVINIKSCQISLADQAVVYNGKSQEPKLIVTDKTGIASDGTVTLALTKDYKVYYMNNKLAGTASVRVSGIGYYAGSKKIDFEISPLDLSSSAISLDSQEYYYDGTQKTPSVTVEGVNLIEDTDYTLQYQDNLEVGQGSVVVTGKGSCTGKTTKTFTIKPGKIEDCTISLSESSYPYSGEEIKPEVQVMNQKYIALEEGVDYTLAYSENLGVGTATVLISGQGNYTGEAEQTFEITKIDISDCKITLPKTELTYTGQAIEPEVQIVNGQNVALVKGKDYTVTCQNNTNVGTAMLTITGQGNYTGEVDKNFKIIQGTTGDTGNTGNSGNTGNTGNTGNSGNTGNTGDTGNTGNTGSTVGGGLSGCSIIMLISQYDYSGLAITPTIQVKNQQNVILSPGVDYVISYSDNVNAGTGKIIVTGKGRYTGQIMQSFTINKASQVLNYPKKCTVKKKNKKVKLRISHMEGNGKLSYRSSDKNTVKVSKKGVMTLKRKGTVTITVKAAKTENYKAKTVKIKVKVK